MLSHSIFSKIYPRRLAGILIISLGSICLVLTCVYFLYAWIGNENLKVLNYKNVSSSDLKYFSSSTNLGNLEMELPSKPSSLVNGLDPANYPLYPGEMMPFSSWIDPWNIQTLSDNESITTGFAPIPDPLIKKAGTLAPAIRIRIPAISLDALIHDLEILDLGDSLQYDTPKNVVGHIPESSNPGERGNNWLFGHLQSPIRNEGSVFRDLPKIPDMLRSGERIYAILHTPEHEYLYELYRSEWINQEDLELYDTKESTVTLVTCFPELLYDKRQLVSGKLVGFKSNN